MKMQSVKILLRDVRGATAIEYGLLVALVAISAIGAMQGLGDELNSTFNTTSAGLAVASGANTGTTPTATPLGG